MDLDNHGGSARIRLHIGFDFAHELFGQMGRRYLFGTSRNGGQNTKMYAVAMLQVFYTVWSCQCDLEAMQILVLCISRIAPFSK